MKKATITLSNIPSPSGVTKLYAWVDESDNAIYTASDTPLVEDSVVIAQEGYIVGNGVVGTVSENSITINGSSDTYTRSTSDDVEF